MSYIDHSPYNQSNRPAGISLSHYRKMLKEHAERIERWHREWNAKSEATRCRKPIAGSFYEDGRPVECCRDHDHEGDCDDIPF